MKRFLILSLLGALATPAPATTPLPSIEAPVLVTHLEGELVLDPAGAVESYQVSSPVPTAVALKAQELVRRLRFEPVVVDGRASRAHARMRMTLVGTPLDDDRFDMRLDGLSFPDDREASSVPAPGPQDVRLKVDRKSHPRYPRAAARIGVDADVVVLVKIARDGRIADASIGQSAILGAGGDPKAVARVLADFEQESLRTVRGWHVDVRIPEGVEPSDEQLTACIPVRFRMLGHPAEKPAGEWQWIVRTPKRHAPWLPARVERPLAGVADIGGGDLLSAQTRFRLASPPSPQAL